MRNKHRWLIVGVFCVGLASTGGVTVGHWLDDSRRFQGTWKMDDGRFWTVFGDQIHFGGGPREHDAYFQLEPLANPPRITLHDPSNRYPRQLLGITFSYGYHAAPHNTFRGIYKLDGDRLLIQLSRRNDEFPASFEEEDNSVYHLQRQ